MKPGVQTKIFYPSKSDTIRYLTPVERKEIRELKKNESSTDNSLLNAEMITKLPKSQYQGHRRMAKKKSRSLKNKFKPFSSQPIPISKKEKKSLTTNWAPKSMSQAKWKGYEIFRETLKFNPPIEIDLDIFKKDDFHASSPSPIQEDKDKPVPVQIENDENTPPVIQNVEVPVEPLQKPSIATADCDRTKKVSKFFPIFEKVSRNRQSQTGIARKPQKSQMAPKKLTFIEKSNSQYIIDAGQKKFGATQCSICGMVFTASHPVDEQDHQRYHKRFLGIIKFPGWKNERVVTSFMDGRIIKVSPSDLQYAVQKVVDILGIVDVDLGFQTPNIGFAASKVAYLYISDEQKVAGCIIAEKIEKAYHLMPSDEGDDVGAYGDRLYCTDHTPVPTICGISRIWTYAPLRRKKIATRLVDAVRASFVLGMCLSPSHVAFSDPTPDGRCFALKYFGASNVLVYNLLQ